MEQVTAQPRSWTPARLRSLGVVGVALLWIVLLLAFGSSDVVGWAVRAIPRSSLLILATALLEIVPGWAALQLLWPDLARSRLEKLGLAWSVSVALPPLLLEIARLIRLSWQTWTTYLYLLIALVVLLWPYLRRPRPALPRFNLSLQAWIVAALLGLALIVRLYLVRDLPVGLWGDSYQHTMMTQLLVDNSGLFSSWQPYAPLATFTYHFGFQANAAFLHWLTGISVPQSVLIVGQWLNTAVLAGAYVLTSRLTRNRTAGLWAVLLTGYVNTQPLYYVNWGRYTQLAGQVVLIVVLIAWIALLEQERVGWRHILLTAIVTACLMLTHYIVTIFAAVFLAAYLVVHWTRTPTLAVAKTAALRTILAGGLAVTLTLPWLINTLQGYLGRNVSGFVSASVGADRIAEQSTLTSIVPTYIATPILILAAIGVVLALARRDRGTLLLAVWSALLILLVVPNIVGLPGAGVVPWLAAYIALYIPLIPLAAYTLGAAQDAIAQRRRAIGIGLATGAAILVSVWALRWQSQLIDRQFQLFTPADDAAMAWIRDNTPPDARILVNMFPAYGGTLFAGSDGGWWIPLLTKRQTTLPPLTYGSERAESPDYAKRINQFGYALRQNPLPSDAGIALLREAGISYIYSGANNTRPDKFDVAALKQNPAFRVAYDRDGVTIFALNPRP